MKLKHFTAEWCQPCKMMKPIIKQVIEEHPEIEYEMIDIDQNPDMAKVSGVSGVPTFILENNGEVLANIVGAFPKNDFYQKLGLT